MTDQSAPLFSFDEADHLTRIHLMLALEDVGFSVRERGETVAIVPAPIMAAPIPNGHPSRHALLPAPR